MRKVLMLISLMVGSMMLVGCDQTPDFTSASELEASLNDGEDVSGMTVFIEVNKVEPNSAFGYNIQSGKHLNFVNIDNPGVDEGDEIFLKIVEARSILGSYIITYEK